MSSTMFLKLLAVIATLISPLVAQMDDQFLGDEILPRCYKYPVYEDGRLYVNGQENPLANSLENFINLVEKFELANPDFLLKEVLLILLENYTTENVEYTFSQGVSQLDVMNPPKGMVKHDIDKVMDTGINRENIRYPHNDPFDDNEKCSLYFMLTRSINATAMRGIDSIETSPDSTPDELKNRYFPREQGVVSIFNSSVQSVAIGRVIKGLFLGLNGGSQKKLREVKDQFQIKLDLAALGPLVEETILPLYLTTLADQLVLANAENIQYPSEVLRKDGKWKSVQKPGVGTNADELDIICPLTYVLPSDSDTGSSYTYSSVRGGIDGLILGNIISSIEKSDSLVKLSKILRMYYSPSGITENTQAPKLNTKATFCKRSSAIDNLIETLKTQLKLYYIISAKSLSPEVIETKSTSSWKLYDDHKNDILTLDQELRNICEEEFNKDNYDTYPIETSSDIVVVMDTTQNKDTFEKQQMIIGHLANKLDIRYDGSSLTVFLDRKNDTSGLINVLSQEFSSACSACFINQYELPGGLSGETLKEYTIDSITKVLYEMKNEENTLGGAKGKIVIYFDFGAEAKLNSKPPQRALRDFYKHHRDVQVFAVGNNEDVMKLYTQNNKHNTVAVPNNPPSEVADILASKIKEVPSRLQYKDCNKTNNVKSDLFEGLITPGARQRWSMAADYFYKSYVSKVIFEAKKGDITVCHNRARPYPEIAKGKLCKHTSPSVRSLEFINTNPCKGFQKETCSQMFFTVMGALPTDDTDTQSNSESQNGYCRDTKDAKCKTLNQIPFTVKQDGIRCSGCGKILSSPLMLLAVCIIAYFMKFSS